MTAGKLHAAFALLLLPGSLLAADSTVVEVKDTPVFMDMEKPGTLRLEATNASWEQIFDEVADKTGTQMHYPPPPQALVTATCEGKTLQQVMTCLLGSEGDFIVRDTDGVQNSDRLDIPAEIWVLNSSFGIQKPPPAAEKNSGRCTVRNKQATSAPCEPTETTSVSTETVQSTEDKTSQLLQLVHAEDPAARAEAIASLASEQQMNAADIREMLAAALSDENPDVRAQALSGLAQREGAAAASVLQEALQDSDVSVRLMAVDNAGNNTALLQQALADSDATVRSLAAMKLGLPSEQGADQ